jgi:serine/threonine protein kinase/tetratricopeptide (TPR) repeat protein
MQRRRSGAGMIGEKIAHYKILEKIGEGGMDVVYKAEDTKLKRKVALKFLSAHELQFPEFKKRFIQEAQAVAALDHPNICVVHEIYESDAYTFIVMAYIKGQSLKEKISTKKLNQDEALDIAIQVVQGLEEAHEKGIVHRDIKPANIMITEKGQVKIMDFGVAKLSMEAGITLTVGIIGTLAYMSPEQAIGEGVDARTDIWSLGVCLYEMLAGRHPFAGDTQQAMISGILNKDPELLAVSVPRILPGLDQVIHRTLAKDKKLRYASARELLEDLKKVRERQIPPTPIAKPSEQKNFVAILDFANITNDPTCDWLSSGIAETVTVDLKKIAALQVVSRERVSAVLGKNAGQKVTEQQVIALGNSLNARWIVWSGFQKMGEAIRITTHFTEVSTGNLVGSTKVDGTMDNIFRLQDRIITNLMESLDLEMSDTEIQKIETPETIELEAYEYYAKGRQIHNQMGKEGMSEAIKLMKKALEIDPEYALAYSGLGAIHMIKFIAQTDPNDLDTGIVYLEEAINRDPDLSDPYQWLTYGYSRKLLFARAIRSGKKAVELEPHNPLAHYFLGVALTVQAAMEYTLENYPDAVRHYQINIELQPNYVPAYMNVSWIYLLHGQYEEAETYLKKAAALEETGKQAMVRFVGAQTMLGNVFFRQGHLDKARSLYLRSRKFLERTDHVYTGPFLALTTYGFGNLELEKGLIDRALEQYKKANEIIHQYSKSLGIGYMLIKVCLGMAKAFHLLGLSRVEEIHFLKARELFQHKEGFDFSWVWEGSDPQVYYEFASYHACVHDEEDTFLNLQKAIDCGWAELPLLERDSSFESLRNHTACLKIVEVLQKRERLP